MNNYWYGILTVFVLILSLGCSTWYEGKAGRPIIHWFLGLIAGAGAIAWLILGIWM